MNAWTCLRRALLFALLLPALLVPSGWSWTVCFCAAMSAAEAPAQAACCRIETKSCCNSEQQESTPAPGSRHRCDECREFGSDNRGLPRNLPSTPDVPPMVACATSVWAVPQVFEAFDCAARPMTRALAPPCTAAALPLRI